MLLAVSLKATRTLIDIWGLASQNHHTIMGDAKEEGSGNFDHLEFFNVHLRQRGQS